MRRIWKKPRRGSRLGRGRLPSQAMQRTPTPGKSTCADVAELLGLPIEQHRQVTGPCNRSGRCERVWQRRRASGCLLLRGDHDMNEIKVGKVAGLDQGFRFATVAEEIQTHFACRPGYLGPIPNNQAMRKPGARNRIAAAASQGAWAVQVVVDREVALMSRLGVCGANEPGLSS